MIVPHASIRADTLALYEAGGLPSGSSTGWPSLNRFYTVAMNQWTLVTGTPNSGKSEWLDALMVNLARRERWRFFIYSPENWPLAMHHAKIAEKYVGKPFDPGPTPRMHAEELEETEAWMEDKFFFGKPERPELIAILDEACKTVATTTGTWKTGIVVDPWNHLEHYRPDRMTETENISKQLSDVIQIVRAYNVHFWLVAHPKLMQKNRDGSYPIPRPFDVAGSAHFWNKSDNCITIWRDQGEGTQEVQVHVQKVRFKHVGRIGVAELMYDRVTGRYHEKLQAVSRQIDSKSRAAGEAP